MEIYQSNAITDMLITGISRRKKLTSSMQKLFHSFNEEFHKNTKLSLIHHLFYEKLQRYGIKGNGKCFCN